MTSLSCFSVGSFKAFDSTQALPIRPITLLFGPNSAGKSSVVHALAYLNEAQVGGVLNVKRPRIGGTSIDLGGFPNFVHRRTPSTRCHFVLEFDVRALPKEFTSLIAGEPTRVALSLTIGGTNIEPRQIELIDVPTAGVGVAVAVTEFSLSIDGAEALRVSRRRDGSFRCEVLGREWRLDVGIGLAQRQALREAESSAAWQQVDRALQGWRISGGGLVPTVIEAATAEPPRSLASHKRMNRYEDGAIALLRAILLRLNGILNDNIGRMRYLGPLRSYPPRHVHEASTEDPDWVAGGAYAWDLVANDDALRTKLNRWLGREALQTRYELAVQTYAPIEEIRQPLLAHLEALEFKELQRAAGSEEPEYPHVVHDPPPERDWQLDEAILSIRQASSGLLTSLALRDMRSGMLVSHRDVGIGISQVLPVLALAHAAKGDLVAIEQPELHLHPALQSELADVFIESALERQNTFLLETHSEHLMLRILRRIREAAETLNPRIRPDHVSVLFVEPGESGTVITPIPIREDGEFGAAWPQGFFAERMKELF